MKFEVDWRGQVYSMEWFDDLDFEALDNVTQVYGFVFDDEGEVCIVKNAESGNWVMPGGGVEDYDDSFEDTLTREVDEEADLKIKNIVRLGYWKISPVSDNCEKGIHYATRMIADLDEVLEQTVDPCHGMMNERRFVLPEKFNEWVKWGDSGEFQIGKAVKAWENSKKN